MLVDGNLLLEDKKNHMIKTYLLLAYHVKTISNNLTSLLLHDNDIKHYKTHNTSSIDHFIKKVNSIKLELTSLDTDKISKKIDYTLQEKSLLIIIGDFLGDFDLSLLAKKHELFIIIIRDSFEQNPTILGDIQAKDPVSGEIERFNFDKYARDKYKKRFEKNDEILYKHLRSIKATYIKIVTDEDVYKKLYL